MSEEWYRVKAAELIQLSSAETSPRLKMHLQSLALAYLRLAQQAKLNSRNDLVYETPARQQQQQIQPKEDDE